MHPADTTEKYTKIIFCMLTAFVLVAATVCPAEAASRLAVSAEVANTRSGPGTDHEQLWQMELYTPVKVLDSQDSWYFFEDFEGTRGWIYKDLVSEIDTVITKKGLINVRTGPGTNHDVAFQAEKGVPFRVLERKGDWLHIQHADGEKGWIYSALVW